MWACSSATKTERAIVFPGRYTQVTLEQMELGWQTATKAQQSPLFNKA